MNTLFIAINQFFYLLPDRMIKARWWVLALTLLGTMLMAFGIGTRFNFDQSFEGMLDEGDPAQAALDEFRRQFGSDDSIYIVYRASDGDVFSPSALATMRQLTNDIEQAIAADQLPRAVAIDSLTNIKAQVDQNGSLVAQDLVPDSIPPDTSAIRALASQQPGLELAYYSTNYQYGGFTIKTDFGVIPVAQDEAELSDDVFSDFSLTLDPSAEVRTVEFEDVDFLSYLDIMAALDEILADPAYASFEFYKSGTPALTADSFAVMNQAMMLVGLMLILVIALLWWLLRTASAVIWPILAIILSSIWAIGIASWAGMTMTTMVTLAVMLILAVGIADCVHVMSAYLFYRREGEPHDEAMRHAWGKTGLAIVLTTLTTAAGMLALSLSGLSLFVEFGLLGAMGVTLALLFTAFILPVLMHWWHPAKSVNNVEHGKIQAVLDGIPNATKKHPWVWVAGFGVLFAASLLGANQIKIDSNMMELFRDGTPIKETYRVIDENMMGTSNMIVMVDTVASEGVKDPVVLNAMWQLQQALEKQYPEYILRTYSLADVVRYNHDLLTAEGESIPTDARVTSQLLYLFDSSDPDSRRQLVSDDYSRSHISVSMRNAGSAEYAAINDEINMLIEQSFAPVYELYPDTKVQMTGTFAMMMNFTQQLSDVQFRGITIALLLITAVMIVSMGSIQAGLIGIIPNLIPALSIFGIAGWFGIAMDGDTLMIVPIIIGIAVDDTIHFITHYRNLLLKGEEEETALRHTIKEVGQAVTFTTIILGISFAVLLGSAYLGLAKVGGFAAMALFIALANDLYLIPALIRIFKPRFGVKKPNGVTAS